jgi:peptidoglycan/LPS O-acetylase OafA/YrhL
MIIADLYVSKDIPKLGSSFIGWLGLLIILFINRESSNLNELIFFLGCFILFLFVLANDYWKRIFATKSISLIGGMCYSIYLLHYPIISFFGTYFSTIYLPENQIDFILYFIVLFPVILTFSTVFYLLIEKPCMDSTWPTKLKDFIFKN